MLSLSVRSVDRTTVIMQTDLSESHVSVATERPKKCDLPLFNTFTCLNSTLWHLMSFLWLYLDLHEQKESKFLLGLNWFKVKQQIMQVYCIQQLVL